MSGVWFRRGAAAALVFGAGALLWSGTDSVVAQQRAGCAAGPAALGLARTIEIDTIGGPRFGHGQYPQAANLLQPGEVVLTFDDGPHPAYTRPILDALDAHCTKATFFMVGQRALSYRQLVRDVATRGHTVATHTWSHKKQAALPPDRARAEMELGISAVQLSLGAPAAPIFRFPYLSDPAYSVQHLRARNTAIFSIDVDSFDFRTRSPTRMINNVLQGLAKKGKGIILFHDIQPATARGLPTLLAELKARGYRVVHVRARQPQVTLAEFDRSIMHEHGGSRLALAGPVPVDQRAFMRPDWEIRVTPQPAAAPGVRPAPTRPLPPARPALRGTIDDWRSSVFRGY